MSKLMRQPLEIEELCMRVEEVNECIREIHVEMELEKQAEDEHLEEEAMDSIFVPELLIQSDSPTPPSIEKPP